MSSTHGVRCMLLRGGSSKGAFFVSDDLPDDPAQRDLLLQQIMGTPDPRQIDGVGGAHPLTSKVAIVGPTSRPDADVDYLFLQLGVDQPTVSDRQNCGNLLAGVGPFAVERGLIAPITETGPTEQRIRIHMRNTGSVATATVPLCDGQPDYDGDTAISGVPGHAAPILLDFEDIAGGTADNLLPTGRTRDTVTGIDCTLIDNGMPVIVLRADAVGITGYESCAELEADDELRARLEALRLAAGPMMNLGDVTGTTIPKLTMVAPPRDGGALCTRTFIPHRCHEAIGVLGAVSVATAARLPGSPAAEVAEGGDGDTVVLEHPTGHFAATVGIDGDSANDPDGNTNIDSGHDSGNEPGGEITPVPAIRRAGIVRTARKLMDGVVFPRTY